MSASPLRPRCADMCGQTVRIRGGKRQPRYYYLKDTGAERLVRYLSSNRQCDCRSMIQRLIDEMTLACRQVDEAFADIAERYR